MPWTSTLRPPPGYGTRPRSSSRSCSRNEAGDGCPSTPGEDTRGRRALPRGRAPGRELQPAEGSRVAMNHLDWLTVEALGGAVRGEPVLPRILACQRVIPAG